MNAVCSLNTGVFHQIFISHIPETVLITYTEFKKHKQNVKRPLLLMGTVND